MQKQITPQVSNVQSGFFDLIRKYAAPASEKKYKKKTRYEIVTGADGAISFVSTRTGSVVSIRKSQDRGMVLLSVDSKYADMDDIQKYRGQEKGSTDSSGSELIPYNHISGILNALWALENREIRFERMMRVVNLGMILLFILYLIFSQVAVRTSDSGVSLSENGTLQYQLDISNTKGKSWIRVKLNTSTDNNVSSDYLEDHLILADGWEKYGDWYYYTKPAEPGETYPVVIGTTLSVGEVSSMQIGVTGQAVQYLFTRPDFESNDPWSHLDHKFNIGVRGNIDRISPNISGIEN